MGELATLVKYKLPVKVIVIKNNVAGADQVGADGLRGQPGVRRASCSRSTSPSTRRRAAPPASRSTIRRKAETVLREAFAHHGPGGGARRWSTPTSRRCPATRLEQALHFAESLVRGEKDRWDIIKTVLEDTVREVV